MVQNNGLNPDDYGITIIPLDGDPNAGVLGGGTLAAVNVNTTEAERDAAVQWIDWYYMNKLRSEEGAVTDAEALVANNQPVGVPALPIFDKATYDQQQAWIADYINVPSDQMTGFTSAIFDQPLVQRAGGPHPGDLRGPRPRRAGRAHRPERGHRRPARRRERPGPDAPDAAADPTLLRDPGPGGEPGPRRVRRHHGPEMASSGHAASGDPEVTRDRMGVLTGVAVTPRRRRRTRALVTRDGLGTLVFLLPLLLVFGVFAWFPIMRAVVMSFQETNLVSEPVWVGLDNFRRVLADPLFGKAVANTPWFAFLALVFGFPVPLILAVLMSTVRRRRGLYSALAYLPVVVPPVVAVLLWQQSSSRQPDGRVQHHPGLARASARSHGSRTPATAMPSIVIEATWAAAGATVIIYLAALISGPARAVRRRGGRRGVAVAKVRHVTLPQLRAVLFVILILQLIGTAQVFLEPFLFTGGGPDNATITVLLLIYSYAFQNSLGGDYGTATALSA